MTTSTNNKWAVGELVTIGFIRNLKVVGFHPGSGEFELVSSKGARYSFLPYQGLVRL